MSSTKNFRVERRDFLYLGAGGLGVLGLPELFGGSVESSNIAEDGVDDKALVRVHDAKGGVKIETDTYEAVVTPHGGPRTGILGGTFLDKKTGARSLGHGLNVTDYPCVPPEPGDTQSQGDPLIYGSRKLLVGVEGPQLCCAGGARIEFNVARERTFAVVHEWFTFQRPDGKPGARWDEWLLFPSGKRYFFAFNKLTSAYKYTGLTLGGDWPGHVKAENIPLLEKVYLSYHGEIPVSEFDHTFPPDTRFFYQRSSPNIPERMIRAYRIRVQDKPGPWLGCLTLDPSMMWQGWCHRREWVCFIGLLGGVNVEPGESFSNVNLIGFFDSIDEMNDVYDRYKCSTDAVTAADLFRFIAS